LAQAQMLCDADTIVSFAVGRLLKASPFLHRVGAVGTRPGPDP